MKEQTIPDALRFAPLHAAWMADASGRGSWCVMTRRDETPGTLNNFSVAECQHKADAVFLASAPDLLKQRDQLRQALKSLLSAVDRESGRTEWWLKNIRDNARAVLAETEAK